MSSMRPWSVSTTLTSESGCVPSLFLEPGAPQDVEEIKLYVKNNLARYKVPRDVVFIDELPRNATGKLLRRVLTEMDVDS